MKPLSSLLGVILVVSFALAAQPIPWIGQPFFIASRNSQLSTILQDLGANYNLPVVVSPQVNDSYAGQLRDEPKGSALAELARLYQLVPYYNGNTLYIYKSQQIGQTILSPLYINSSRLARALQSSGLLNGMACQMHPLGNSKVLQISGVPACLQQVTMLAKQLDDQNLNQEQDRETVAIFPLKYASANDINYNYRDKNVVIPGLVSILREMNQSGALPVTTGKNASVINENNPEPTFSADIRQNAVLVRDLKKNMGIYNDIIPRLDKRPDLVEISVAIIDVDAGNINQLGIDWSASANLAGGTVSFNNDNASVDNNNSFSSLITNSGNFMVRLSALEQQSKAKIISRPSVITLDNEPAVLDRNITFYTKLNSKNDPKLQSITAGSLMQVTPRLIHEQGGDRVLLTLNIQDGRQSQPLSEAEPLPQVQSAEIATQATLNVGQALLLGGFVQNEHVDGVRKIPLLGDLPLVGGLFRTTKSSDQSVVRLFLIKAEPRQL